jgi:hypothetical protein
MIIYHDSDVTVWKLEQVGLDHQRVTLEEFFSSSQHKIACYHVPFPEETTWIDRFNRTYLSADHTLIFCSELHDATVDQLISLDLPRVTMLVCGVINHQFNHAQICPWMDWFIIPTYFYRVVKPNFLREHLLPQINKPKKFDMLLGMLRKHRTFIYNYVKARPTLDQQGIVTYFKTVYGDLLNSQQFILDDPGVTLINPIRFSIDNVDYYGHRMNLSTIVPIKVYNDSYYSVVAETNYSNLYNFYTEKIVKPIISGRLFVAVAGQHYLRNLKSLGIETFSGVIDESYDTVADPQQRWTMAMQQVEYLCLQDPTEIYSKIQPIVEHNKRVLLEKDWQADVSRELRAVVLDHTRQN